MKKIFLIFACVSLLLSLASCGGQTGDNQKDDAQRQTERTTERVDLPQGSTAGGLETTGGKGTEGNQYDKDDPDSILASLETAFKNAGQALEKEADSLINALGNSYDTYKEQKPSVDAFYSGAIENAGKLYADAEAMGADYFRYVAAHDMDEYKVWDRAMEDIYDAWDDGMNDYYDSWSDSFEDVYEKCRRIIEDEADELEYSEYSDGWSENYEVYSDSWSEMYDIYSNAWSDGYDRYNAVWEGFFDGNTDVDAILKEAAESGDQEESTDPPATEPPSETTPPETTPPETTPPETTPPETTPPETTPPETTPEETGVPPADGIRPEFKKAMDEYEAFYREYVDFMKKYQESDNSIAMLSDYLSMLKRLAEAEEALGDMKEGEMSAEELRYYTEVTLRITEMLAEVR